MADVLDRVILGVVAPRHVLVRERNGSSGISVAVVCDYSGIFHANEFVILGVFRAHLLRAALFLSEDMSSIVHFTRLRLVYLAGLFGMVCEGMHCR